MKDLAVQGSFELIDIRRRNQSVFVFGRAGSKKKQVAVFGEWFLSLLALDDAL